MSQTFKINFDKLTYIFCKKCMIYYLFIFAIRCKIYIKYHRSQKGIFYDILLFRNWKFNLKVFKLIITNSNKITTLIIQKQLPGFGTIIAKTNNSRRNVSFLDVKLISLFCYAPSEDWSSIRFQMDLRVKNYFFRIEIHWND